MRNETRLKKNEKGYKAPFIKGHHDRKQNYRGHQCPLAGEPTCDELTVVLAVLTNMRKRLHMDRTCTRC